VKFTESLLVKVLPRGLLLTLLTPIVKKREVELNKIQTR